MKLKIIFIKVNHIPNDPKAFTSWTFKVKYKKKLVHHGFISGPFFKTKKKAKQGLINLFYHANLFQEKL